MPTVDDLRAALARRTPAVLEGRRRAAVALVLHEAPAGPAMLFIERARRLGDPWSGDMAFPGGRVDPSDADARAAAERETREEVGLDLAPAERLGRLDDLQAGIPWLAPFVLSGFVYRLPARTPLRPNVEVREAFWVPVSDLLDPDRQTGHRVAGVRFPAICVGEPGRPVVWGLTYRLLDGLLATAGTRLPGWGWPFG